MPIRVMTALAVLLAGATAACGSNTASGSNATSGSTSASSPSGSPLAAAVPAGVQFDPKPGAPSGQQALVDPATLPAPGGASYPGCPALTPSINPGTAETMATQGSNRVVAAVRVLSDGSYNNANGSADTVVWHSANGGPWALVDIRSALGPLLNHLSVAATPDGFAAFGSVIAGCGTYGVSTAVVLVSPDGITWTKTADLRRPFSTQPNRLLVVGKNLLLSGPEYVCAGNPFSLTPLLVGQARFWRSSDGGHTWTAVPVASIGVLDQPAAPADQSGCHVVTGREYSAPGPLVSVAGSQAAIFGNDGTRVALSNDLTTWTAAPLPGLPAGTAVNQQHQPVAASVVQQNGQLYALTLVDRYSTARQQYLSGEEPRAWVSADGGKTFTAEPQGRPLDIDGDMAAAGVTDSGAQLHGSYQVVGGAVEVDVAPAGGGAPRGTTNVLAYRSAAGNFEPWQHCAAAPGADCRFAVLGSSSLAGQDLKGIDFDSADLGTADLSGADLTGANLTNTNADQARLTHTVLAHINARGANFIGMDLSGDDLSGANLSGVNLTGAKFNNATCPDGKPSDIAQPGKAACRL